MTDIIERLRSYRGPWLVPAEAADEIEKLRGEVEIFRRAFLASEAERDAAVAALEIAVRQNEHDMVMTGEECRQCRALLNAARGEK